MHTGTSVPLPTSARAFPHRYTLVLDRTGVLDISREHARTVWPIAGGLPQAITPVAPMISGELDIFVATHIWGCDLYLSQSLEQLFLIPSFRFAQGMRPDSRQ